MRAKILGAFERSAEWREEKRWQLKKKTPKR
jgi:hypothetical protein